MRPGGRAASQLRNRPVISDDCLGGMVGDSWWYEEPRTYHDLYAQSAHDELTDELIDMGNDVSTTQCSAFDSCD